MSELSIVAILKVHQGAEAEMRDLLAAFVPTSRRDRGNLRYELYQDRNDARRFVFVQRWEDEAAYINHDKHGAHIQEFQDKHGPRGPGVLHGSPGFALLERSA